MTSSRSRRGRSIRRSIVWRTAGLLAAEWKPSDTGREAKFYRLTAKGRTAMGAEEASWHRLTEAVGLILATAKGGAS